MGTMLMTMTTMTAVEPTQRTTMTTVTAFWTVTRMMTVTVLRMTRILMTMATAFSTRMTSCKLLISRQFLTEVFDDDLMRIFMPRSPGQLIPKMDRKRRPVFVCLFENFYRTK